MPLADSASPRSSVIPEASIVAAADTAPAAVVMVPEPEFPSTNTASADVGADAPAAPPDVDDQFAVELESHVPDPPTQYLFAICQS